MLAHGTSRMPVAEHAWTPVDHAASCKLRQEAIFRGLGAGQGHDHHSKAYIGRLRTLAFIHRIA